VRISTAPSVVGYVRVSTSRQAAEGVSLEAQRKQINAWAEARGLPVRGIYADEGISGFRTRNRPGVRRALEEACRRGATLVVYSLSRLARSTPDALAIVERLTKAGAHLVSLTEPIDTTSAAGRMVLTLLAAFAQFERDLASERTKNALAHLRAKGRRVSRHVPYGYELAGDRLVQSAKEQNAIALMLSMRQAGASLRQIAGELAARGVRTKHGKAAWTISAIANTLKRSGLAA
jgi:site-specific DNA recombinase